MEEPVKRSIEPHKETQTTAGSRPDIPLLPGERIDDLLTQNLRIIQSRDVFSFSMDAVLLGRFASVPAKGRVLDLCTGNGVIPLLLSTRTRAQIEGVEIQERLAGMAERSVAMNGLRERITIHNADLKHFHETAGHGMYDAVTVNPPYTPLTGSDIKANEHEAIARHEIHCTLEDVVQACARMIKPGGKVSMVHRPHRLADILVLMRKYRIEPKRVRFVHPRAHMEANMVLVEGLRDGKPEMRVLPPLIVYNEDGQYCEEILTIYYGSAGKEDGHADPEKF
ncbi:tRNA1(Val) (adenine(37)-N6)-methyltransferase [Saccharibacillus sp. CPCC 101409]|uniref:tRNA1(Val) (adenine(37)-N6)-methyltransferase n=1 Tax=Saccharibacillus sp. CPCC 101409 TaxID=3058041 RepID=UPI0026738EB4|nr:tRNA1(Val) (adenine(37)-N6)-methyltransferase [Saccharibacillus sp. CPCC 101409]MDO3412920.1 tRNA1(Val) (adenine(37)-N6)-methyltransferase [Saccharibacillus sp. CPCC 101409]